MSRVFKTLNLLNSHTNDFLGLPLQLAIPVCGCVCVCGGGGGTAIDSPVGQARVPHSLDSTRSQAFLLTSSSRLLVIDLVRIVTPPPHVTEHSDHLDH